MPVNSFDDLSCLHVVPSLASITGGPAVSVSTLCGALANQGLTVSICTADDESIAGKGVHPPSLVPVIKYNLGRCWIEQNVFRGELSPVLARAAKSQMILHSHGIWTPESYVADRIARRFQLPHFISCRGMLEPWALSFRRTKKRIAMALYQRRVLETASVLHATSIAEEVAIRAIGLTNPVAVIPNGVGIDVRSRASCREEVDSTWPHLTGKRILLFQSRLHQKKGLDELLSAWESLSPLFPDWLLVLAGHDEQQYARRHSLSGQVDSQKMRVYLGHVPNALGHSLLGSASLVVLPSHSENFGNVVAEALAHSVPVLTTENTPWEGINEIGAGRCISADISGLQTALRDLCSLSEAELGEMGRNGRAWMEREFSWNRVATEMNAVYRWILGFDEMPASVRTLNATTHAQPLTSAA